MTPLEFFIHAAVLSAMALLAVNDARKFLIPPKAILALFAAGFIAHLNGEGSFWKPVIGAAIGVGIVMLPIMIAIWRRRSWPIYPGDAMMLGAFGFLLGPLGLGWAILAGCGLALAHRVCLQRRRGRPVLAGYCPLGPGMAAGAALVFLCTSAGVAKADSAHRVTETSQLPAHLEQLDTHLQVNGSFADVLARIVTLSGFPVVAEERPSRVAGGARQLPSPGPMQFDWKGPLPGLLDLVAHESGYDWTWRRGVIVFYRYRDREQRLPGSLPRTAPESAGPWVVDRNRHKTLRDVLEGWAASSGWSVVWKPRRNFTVGADATFKGDFLQAIDLLLASPATRRTLSAVAYMSNRHLVIGDAGVIRP